MNKKDFLEILRQSLDQEVGKDIIDQNIRYYDEYINSHSDRNVEDVINELGDPRLIAKTIIETEKVARHKSSYSENRSYQDNNEYDQKQDESDDNRGFHGYSSNKNTIFFSNLKWYHKAIIISIIILFLMILLILGRFLFRLLFVFIVPLFFIYLLWMLFRHR